MMPDYSEALTVALEVNDLARRNRHAKVFSRSEIFKSYFSKLWGYTLGGLSGLRNVIGINKMERLLTAVPVSPQKKLFIHAGIISLVAVFATSLTPAATFSSTDFSYANDYINEYYFASDIVVNEDGYLVKINPQTDHSNRIGLTDYAIHTVESGESLSLIAEKYDLTLKTLMWENNVANANSLRVGQKLLIPPVNGISYEVQSGDSLDKLAEKYKISSESIIAQNSLGGETLVKGQNLFLPGAEPINPPSVIADGRGGYPATRSTRSYADASGSSDAPAVGRIFIYPTIGNITNGYKSGHYAIDIANTSMPPIWAAGGGTVTKVSVGTWGGGYGNHVVIDHGNGLQTLYAHMDSVNVEDGQWVNQGDVIGIMGNTGRVYGVTGIHVHWEVIQDGVKQYPGDYY